MLCLVGTVRLGREYYNSEKREEASQMFFFSTSSTSKIATGRLHPTVAERSLISGYSCFFASWTCFLSPSKKTERHDGAGLSVASQAIAIPSIAVLVPRNAP